METIMFTVKGEPVAQGRPKFTTVNGYPRAYDPKPSAEYKRYIRLVAAQEMGDRPPVSEAIELKLFVYRQMPKSFSKKKRELVLTDQVLPTTRPDLDNYIKAVKDALSGVCWIDDAQVVSLCAKKLYSETPRIAIRIDGVGGIDG